MSPQERAGAILGFLSNAYFDINQDIYRNAIADEIRAAESDAYEQAAKIADGYQAQESTFVDGTTGGFQAAHAADCCVDIAEDIRALKETI